MSRVFERSDQLKEKVFDVKLRIDEWRVLFAVNGAMDSQAIADFLDLDESDVDGTLDKLLDMKFVTTFDTNSKAEEEAAVAEEWEEETENIKDTAEEFFEVEEFTVEETATEEISSGEVDLDEMISESAEEMSEEEPSAEDDLDELIGNLLEEEPTEVPQAEEPGEEIDFSEEPSAEKQEADEEFDLETIFQEEVAEAEESLEEEAEVETEEKTPPAAEVAEPAAGVGTILVVDDSVVIRKMVEIALENESYNIVSVATGKEALNYLDETTPDLIILDIMLTDMNGLDVLKAIKASKQIPVVMLSAKDTPRETTKAKQLGADDFIPKPFKDEELVGKIKELIKR